MEDKTIECALPLCAMWLNAQLGVAGALCEACVTGRLSGLKWIGMESTRRPTSTGRKHCEENNVITTLVGRPITQPFCWGMKCTLTPLDNRPAEKESALIFWLLYHKLKLIIEIYSFVWRLLAGRQVGMLCWCAGRLGMNTSRDFTLILLIINNPFLP